MDIISLFLQATAVLLLFLGIRTIVLNYIGVSPNQKDSEDKSKSPYAKVMSDATFEDQLVEALLMISSSLKAGRNLDQAFELVAISTPAPICNEFRTLVQERRLGVNLTDALNNLAARVNSPDLDLAVNATIFQQETGGNLEDLYKQIVQTVTERKKIMGKIRAGSAHARISGNMVALIPVFLIILMFFLRRDYLVPMIKDPTGLLILAVTAVLYFAGLLLINNLTSYLVPASEESMIPKNPNTRFAIRTRNLLKAAVKPIVTLIDKLFPGQDKKQAFEDARYLMDAADRSGFYTPQEFVGLQALSALIVAIIYILLMLISGASTFGHFLMVIVLIYLAYQVPKLHMMHRVKERQKNIEFELPYIIDLLSLAVESGYDLITSITKIVEKSRNTDIIIEFKKLIADTKVGKSLEEALTNMASRVGVLSFFSFVSALVQAQRLGAEIGPTLRAQAEQMRYQKMIQTEEKVNKLPAKLVLPLVLFIFPSIIVIILGPAILQVKLNMPMADKKVAERKVAQTPAVSITEHYELPGKSLPGYASHTMDSQQIKPVANPLSEEDTKTSVILPKEKNKQPSNLYKLSPSQQPKLEAPPSIPVLQPKVPAPPTAVIAPPPAVDVPSKKTTDTSVDAQAKTFYMTFQEDPPPPALGTEQSTTERDTMPPFFMGDDTLPKVQPYYEDYSLDGVE